MRDDRDTFRGAPGAPDALPPRVYWRRRLLVAVAGLTLAALIVWLLPVGGDGRGSDGGSPLGQPDPRPAAAAKSPHRSSPRPTVTVTVTATPKVTVTATPEPVGTPCRKVDTRIAVKPSKNSYGAETDPRLTVRVEPAKRCWMDPSRLELTISSGDDRIWSSQDCSKGDRKPVRLTPKFPYKHDLTWQRVRSNPALCGSKAPEPRPARPGWYVAAVSLAGDEGGEGVFRLR